MEENKYINKFIKIYPFLKGFTDDLLFFVAIDTLFYTIVKGLTVQQIVFLTSISSIVALLGRVTLVKIIEKIGNTNSVRLGIGILLLSSIIITFAKSYSWIMIGKILYEIAWVFKEIENVMLKNNLEIIGKSDNYAQITNKGMNIYAFLTLIVSLTASFLFNINYNLPMYLCIFICFIAFIIYFFMKDISKNNIISSNKHNKKRKVKFNKIIWVVLFSYAVFYGIIVTGQQNTKLLIQYELANIFDAEKVAIYLGIIVAISRLSRLIGSFIFGKVYYKIKNKSLIVLTTILFTSFLLTTIGFLIDFSVLKFILMTIGFCIILAVRDPFKLYVNDIVLKITKPEEKQKAISYVGFSRKTGTTICSLLVSAVLLKWDMIYVIIGIGILSIMEIFITIKLYLMLIAVDDKDNYNKFKKITNKKKEAINQ